MTQIIATIMMIAALYQIDGHFMVAIALTENRQLDTYAVGVNKDGTVDRGLMQLNSSWYNDPAWHDPETNIRAACGLVKELRDRELSYWQTAIAYNCGYATLLRGPPEQSIEYAVKVFEEWDKHGIVLAGQ